MTQTFVSTPINIAQKYRSPFPLYSEHEGRRFQALSRRRITPPLLGPYNQWIEMASMGLDIAEKLCKYIEDLGCLHYIEMHPFTYGNLVLEFFTSLKTSPHGELSYRLSGECFILNTREITKIFGFKGKGNYTQQAKEYNASEFWEFIRDETLDSKDSYNSLHIREVSVYLAHLFVTECVLGKTHEEAKFIELPELYVLWCMINKKKVDITPLIIARMREIIRTDVDVPLNLSMGTLVTILAESGRVEWHKVRKMKPDFLKYQDEDS